MRRSTHVLVFVILAFNIANWARAESARDEFIARIAGVLPKSGSLFVDFGHSSSGALGVRIGFDFATGAYYRVFSEPTNTRSVVRQSDGRLFQFDDRTTVFNEESAANRGRLDEPKLFVVVPALALWNLHLHPESIDRVTKVAGDYHVRFDSSVFFSEQSGRSLSEKKVFVEHVYDSNLSLLKELRDGSDWEMERVEGIPITLPQKTRGGWVRQSAEFIPSGALDRFSLESVRKTAEPLRGGSINKITKHVPSLTEVANGTDGLGDPIVTSPSPSSIRTSRPFDWTLVGIAGVLFVAVGLAAWWRKR